MFALKPKPRFRRKLRKLLKKDPALSERVQVVLNKLKDDPRNPSLGSHKVSTWDSKPAFSVEVTGDLRVTWRYSQGEENVLELVDIGGHSGSKKVYR